MWLELPLWHARRWLGALGRADRLALLWLLLLLAAGCVAPAFVDRALLVDPLAASAPPSLQHPLGTDHLGRDIGWRLLVGASAFVGPAAGALLTAFGLGLPLGLLAGGTAGPASQLLTWLGAVVTAVPRFVLVLLVLSVFGPSLVLFAGVAGLCYAPALADEIGARVAGLRTDAFLLASRAHGVPLARRVGWHLLLGACADLLRAHALRLVAFVVVLETSLSYLGGFGVQEPAPSWGNMLAFDWGWTVHPVAATAPAAVLWLTLAALSTLAGPPKDPP